MEPLERAVLLRSLGTNSGKFYLPRQRAALSRAPLAGRKVPGPQTRNRNRIFLNFCRAYPQRGLTAKAGGPLQRRHETGLIRMRPMAMARPPSHKPTASAAFAGMVLPRLWACAFIALPDAGYSAPRPCHPRFPSCAVSGAALAGVLCLGTGSEARPVRCGTHGRCMTRNRLAISATDGQNATLDHFGETATGRLRKGLRKSHCGRRSEKVGFGLPIRSTVAEITPRMPGVRRTSCGPRPDGECPDRHCAAWPASPPCYEPLLPGPAWCRKQRRGWRPGQDVIR